MSDYIDDLDLSSLFIDDVDHAFVPQDDIAAFESQDAYYVLPSGKSNIASCASYASCASLSNS